MKNLAEKVKFSKIKTKIKLYHLISIILKILEKKKMFEKNIILWNWAENVKICRKTSKFSEKSQNFYNFLFYYSI